MIAEFKGPYHFLSNFWRCVVEFEGEHYPSVEAAYQAAKTTNLSLRRKFQDMTAAEAKRAGQQLVLREDWDRVKLKIMEKLVREKFKDQNLARELKLTGRHRLVEGNWWGDRFWGVCNGEGKNHLGKILMSVRSKL